MTEDIEAFMKAVSDLHEINSLEHAFNAEDRARSEALKVGDRVYYMHLERPEDKSDTGTIVRRWILKDNFPVNYGDILVEVEFDKPDEDGETLIETSAYNLQPV